MQRNVETKERISPLCFISARLQLCSTADSRIKTESFISVHNCGNTPTVNSDGQILKLILNPQSDTMLLLLYLPSLQ